MPTRLQAEDLTHAYGKRQALNEVSLSLEAGALHILLGLNGAGKSTLFGLLTGLLPIQSGRLIANGTTLLRNRADLLGKLGVVFQQSTLDLDLTVRQNLRYHASLHGLSRKQSDTRIDEELERFELLDRAADTVRVLNGGHRRRVELARALLHRPELLLLDEPTVGLDTQTRSLLSSYVRARCQSDQLAVLWATHLMEEVELQDQVTLLHQGSVRFSGIAEQLLEETGAETVGLAFNQLTVTPSEAAQ